MADTIKYMSDGSHYYKGISTDYILDDNSYVANLILASNVYKNALAYLSDKPHSAPFIHRLEQIPYSYVPAEATKQDAKGKSNSYDDSVRNAIQSAFKAIEQCIADYETFINSLPQTQVEQFNEAGVYAQNDPSLLSGSSLTSSGASTAAPVVSSTNPLEYAQHNLNVASTVMDTFFKMVDGGVNAFTGIGNLALGVGQLSLDNQKLGISQRQFNDTLEENKRQFNLGNTRAQEVHDHDMRTKGYSGGTNSVPLSESDQANADNISSAAADVNDQRLSQVQASPFSRANTMRDKSYEIYRSACQFNLVSDFYDKMIAACKKGIEFQYAEQIANFEQQARIEQLDAQAAQSIYNQDYFGAGFGAMNAANDAYSKRNQTSISEAQVIISRLEASIKQFEQFKIQGKYNFASELLMKAADDPDYAPWAYAFMYDMDMNDILMYNPTDNGGSLRAHDMFFWTKEATKASIDASDSNILSNLLTIGSTLMTKGK